MLLTIQHLLANLGNGLLSSHITPLQTRPLKPYLAALTIAVAPVPRGGRGLKLQLQI
ncbi:MAG: hypothetical protein ABL862_09090 [Candidatus Nitrotoga sp.]